MFSGPIFAKALLATEPPHPTPGAHFELFRVIQLWALLVPARYPHLAHGRVREGIEDIRCWRSCRQIGSCDVVAPVLPQLSVDLLHKLFPAALKESVVDRPKEPDERPVKVLILCKEERVEVGDVAGETLEQATDLGLAVAFEDLCNYLPLICGVPC